MKLFGKELNLVILDVDGVILDIVACFERNFEAAALRLGLPLEPFREHIEALRNGEIRGYASLLEGVQGIWPGLTEHEAAYFSRVFREEEKKSPYPPIHGSVQTINWLRRHGIQVALCTTNDEDSLFHRFYSAGVNMLSFAAWSTFESGHPKPDPRALDPIFHKLEVPREEAVYVGDWFPDLDAARGAGVRFIAVLSGGVPHHAFIREGVPDSHIIERLAYLPQLLTL